MLLPSFAHLPSLLKHFCSFARPNAAGTANLPPTTFATCLQPPMHCAYQVMLCCLPPLARPRVFLPAPYTFSGKAFCRHILLYVTPSTTHHTTRLLLHPTPLTPAPLLQTTPSRTHHTSCTPTEGLATSRPPLRRRHHPDSPPQAAQHEFFPTRSNSASLYRPGCPWLLRTAKLCLSCNCVNSVQAAGIAVRQERQMTPATTAQNKQSGLRHVHPTIIFAAC